MSGTGEVREPFAGEERTFAIRLGEIRRIEERCGVGIGEVLRRLSRCVYATANFPGVQALASGVEIKSDDVREVIYQGLLGGAMASAEATKLVSIEIDQRGVRGLLDNAALALTVLWGASQAGDDAPGEPKAGENPATERKGSTSRTSTGRARRSGSRRGKSTS